MQSSGGGNLPAPGPISGIFSVCTGQCITYSVPPVQGASSYQWTLPNGASGNSNSNSITVCFSSHFRRFGGYICVRAIGSCGNSQYTCKFITPINSRPGKPGVITGPATICPPINDTTYCINAVNGATSYQWSISGNSNPSLQILSGQGTTCVHVKIPSGYNGNQKIEVKAVNCAGKSSERVLEIKVFKKPATPGSINGFSSVCKSQI